MKSDSSDISSALKNLSQDDWDRLRLRLWRRFGGQLRNISEGTDPDDLLNDAIVDLLEDGRHCNLDKVTLVNCLFGIVRSKVSYIQTRRKRILDRNQQTVYMDPQRPGTQPHAGLYGNRIDQNDDPLEPELPEESGLYNDILSLVGDDELLKQMVEYRYNYQGSKAPKAQEIANALEVPVTEIYNANRRYKLLNLKLIADTLGIPVKEVREADETRLKSLRREFEQRLEQER